MQFNRIGGAPARFVSIAGTKDAGLKHDIATVAFLLPVYVACGLADTPCAEYSQGCCLAGVEALR